MKIGLDTNCFSDVVDANSPSHDAVKKLFMAADLGRIEIWTSRHVLVELSVKSGIPLDLAKKCKLLPHYVVGSWDEQLISWEQVNSTWAQAKGIDRKQLVLKGLAKTQNSLRDRGIYLDSLMAGMDFFMTSDRQFADKRPSLEIENKFGLKIITPNNFIAKYLEVDAS